MGRTKRKRLQKLNRKVFEKLSTDSSIIELSRWMTEKKWKNEAKLKLARFEETGRGLYSTRRLNKNDTLIEIPFDLMITFVTLQNSEYFKKLVHLSDQKFEIYALISLYLIYEKHLRDESVWSIYLKSLPEFNKNHIPWLCSEYERNHIDAELWKTIDVKRTNFEDSWMRMKLLIQTRKNCPHCSVHLATFLTFDSYLWAYNIICTRSVYVDPGVIREQSNHTLDHVIRDEPNAALSPLLDMFNHSCNVKTTAELKTSTSGLSFRLLTKTSFDKYEQIFISYGNHSNNVLMTEYGFVLPMNVNDNVSFSFDEILSFLKVKIERPQYKILTRKNLTSDLFVSLNGCSYNLKAVLYAFLNENKENLAWKIYSSQFSQQELVAMDKFLKSLLNNKLKTEETRLINLDSENSYNLNLYKCYLRYRMEIIKCILFDMKN